MICDKCHTSQASVVVNHVINGRSSVFHFCEKCAAEQGLIGGRMFKIPIPSFGLVVPSNFYNQAQESLRQDDDLDNQFEDLVIAPLAEKQSLGSTYLEKKIDELTKERNKAIKNEDYRAAAMFRDRIKELKNELN